MTVTFNSDRRYYERVQKTGTYLDTVAASTDQPEPKTVQDFFDHIENQNCIMYWIQWDRLTLQIVLMKIQGYAPARNCQVSEDYRKGAYRRMTAERKSGEDFWIIHDRILTKQVGTNSPAYHLLEIFKRSIRKNSTFAIISVLFYDIPLVTAPYFYGIILQIGLKWIPDGLSNLPYCQFCVC